MPMGKGTYGSRVGRPPKKKRNLRKPDNTTFNAMRRGQTKKFPKKKGGLNPAPVPKSKSGLRTAPVPKKKGMGMGAAPVKQPKRLTGKPRSGVRTATGANRSRTPMLYGRGNRLKK